jgi:hypothetical protein
MITLHQEARRVGEHARSLFVAASVAGLIHTRVRSSQVATAIFRGVVHICALNSSEAQSHRKSANGVALLILIPRSLGNVRPLLPHQCRDDLLLVRLAHHRKSSASFASDLPQLLFAFGGFETPSSLMLIFRLPSEESLKRADHEEYIRSR